jgi:hypothetical protein
MAQTLLMLRTPKGHADVVHVRVPKNRKGSKAGFEFWLRLDRDRHALTECSDPMDDPGNVQRGERERCSKNRQALERDAQTVLRIIAREPGIGTRALRSAVVASGQGIGRETMEAALVVLVQSNRVENRPTQRGKLKDPHYFATGEQAR